VSAPALNEFTDEKSASEPEKMAAESAFFCHTSLQNQPLF
jgi:hypothetical protein